jgi:pSer/pThr/pTyr-binding forkhead associated (FHA) protein
VGRLDDCGLRVSQGLPSRRHAQLSILGQAVWVQDLGSANGTFINGVRIAAKSQLNAGDRVRFDLEEFQFHATAPAAPHVESAATLYRPLAQELAERAPPPAPAAPAIQPATRPTAQPVREQPVAPIEKSIEASPIEASPIEARSIEKAIEKPVATPVAKSGAESAEGSGLIKRPGAWADPDYDDGANKTKFMDPAKLKVMLDTPKGGSAPNAEAVDVPSLVVMSGASLGKRIKLHGELHSGRSAAEWTIGSGADCQVVIADDGVSALHAKLVNDGKRWKLIDQMSANGTYVNGKRSTVSYLSGGDRIVLGPVECEIRLPGATRVESVSPAEPRNKSLMIAAVVCGALVLLGLAWVLWFR